MKSSLASLLMTRLYADCFWCINGIPYACNCHCWKWLASAPFCFLVPSVNNGSEFGRFKETKASNVYGNRSSISNSFVLLTQFLIGKLSLVSLHSMQFQKVSHNPLLIAGHQDFLPSRNQRTQPMVETVTHVQLYHEYIWVSSFLHTNELRMDYGETDIHIPC